MDFPIKEIEEKLGYSFKDKTLLKEAFTHSSYANRFGEKDNERLEYLGDAVLQFVVTEWQYKKDGEANEGKLTALRQKLVCRDALDSAVDGLDIWQYLLVSGTQYNVNGKAKSSLFEAVVAAIYLDGGYDAAKAFIVKYGRLEEQAAPANYKGALQEFLQGKGAPLPTYETVKSGKDNAATFVATVVALGKSAAGEGGSKIKAEQQAAKRLMEMLAKSEK